MNNLLTSTPFMIFGVIVLLYIVLSMGGGKTRAGSSKSLSGSLSKVLMGSGSGKKSSKRSSSGKKYMGFTMNQLLVGVAVIIGLYYYKEGFDASVDKKFNEACDARGTVDTKKVQKLPLMGMDATKKVMAPMDQLSPDPEPEEGR